MKILGIDPGLQLCGYACLQAVGPAAKVVEAGVIRTDSSKAIETRLDQIAADTITILKRFKPDCVAVEQLYSHYEHPRTSILMGHARGVILQTCSRANITVKSFSATRIKKSITGNGRASKNQVQRTVQTLLGLSKLPEPNDVADAIAVALCCANDTAKLP